MTSAMCADNSKLDTILHPKQAWVRCCREKYMRFGLEGGKSVILDRSQATTDGPIILKQHAITCDRSADLQKATNNICVADQPGTTSS